MSSPNTPLITMWNLWNIDQVHFYQNCAHIQLSALTSQFPSLNNGVDNYVINYSQETSNINLESSTRASEVVLPASSGKTLDYADREDSQGRVLEYNALWSTESEATFQKNVFLPLSWSRNKRGRLYLLSVACWSCSAYASTLEVMVSCCFVIQADFQWTLWSCIQKYRILHSHHCENLKSCKIQNGVFWDVTPCGSCKNRRSGGT
jgi:hypothetical protein